MCILCEIRESGEFNQMGQSIMSRVFGGLEQDEIIAEGVELAKTNDLTGKPEDFGNMFSDGFTRGAIHVIREVSPQMQHHNVVLHSVMHAMAAKYKDTPTVLEDMEPLLRHARELADMEIKAGREMMVESLKSIGIRESIFARTEDVTALIDEEYMLIAEQCVARAQDTPLSVVAGVLVKTTEDKIRLGRKAVDMAVRKGVMFDEAAEQYRAGDAAPFFKLMQAQGHA